MAGTGFGFCGNYLEAYTYECVQWILQGKDITNAEYFCHIKEQ